MKNKKQTTLFSRYKNMINQLWEDGQRRYTARELNSFVGDYEWPTSWKQWNNNPYYTTRTYQTELKHLGCITPIKRGLWQINGPIPEWFSSLHIKALLSKGCLKELERSSIVWASIPDKHKVNPWKKSTAQQPLNLNVQADRDKYLRSVYPANVEGSVAFNKANNHSRILPEDHQLLMTKLKSLLDEVEQTKQTKSKMDFDTFKSIIDKLQTINNKVDVAYSLGVDLIDFVDAYESIIVSLLRAVYGSGGLVTFEWWRHDKKWGTDPSCTMTDEHGNLQCETIEELHNYLESL